MNSIAIPIVKGLGVAGSGTAIALP